MTYGLTEETPAKLTYENVTVPANGMCFSFYYYMHGPEPPALALTIEDRECVYCLQKFQLIENIYIPNLIYSMIYFSLVMVCVLL